MFPFERDANGNITKVEGHVNGVERTKTYDKADRFTSSTDSRGGKIDWAYHDKANSKTEKLKEQTITHGVYSSKIAYEYNTGDQNTRVIDGASTYRFDYDEQGHVRTYAAPNRAGSTFNYDQTGKLTDLVMGTPNQLLLSERYEYDKTGNRTKVKHEGPGGKVSETNYVYDPINQLLKESTPNGTVRDYTYDGFGNRTSVKVTEFAAGYYAGRKSYINKNKHIYNKPYVYSNARKAGLKVGGKVFIGIGVIEDLATFGKGAYKGYQQGLKDYDKANKKKIPKKQYNKRKKKGGR
ncbi:hypothetical protein EXW55_30675 (plasmid) [Bacillus mycoides]|nr:hypothetical protein EXW55_30675 [Bacillus mycoides]